MRMNLLMLQRIGYVINAPQSVRHTMEKHCTPSRYHPPPVLRILLYLNIHFGLKFIMKLCSIPISSPSLPFVRVNGKGF